MWWIVGGVLAGLVLLAIGLIVLRTPLEKFARARETDHARLSFRRQREMLEAQFFNLASTLGTPRGVRWLDIQWHDQVAFARSKQATPHTQITAFASISVRFEAIEGGDMEDVAAVGSNRDACALFHYERGTWGTGGRALFNMDPSRALEVFADQFEPLPAQQ